MIHPCLELKLKLVDIFIVVVTLTVLLKFELLLFTFVWLLGQLYDTKYVREFFAFFSILIKFFHITITFLELDLYIFNCWVLLDPFYFK